LSCEIFIDFVGFAYVIWQLSWSLE